jgi:hypothetical protein
VHIIQGRINAQGDGDPFDPANDIALLRATAHEIGGVSLLMLDPIVSAVKGDMHKANDVRRALQGVVDFAEQNLCAVVGISHFAKGGAGSSPADRVIGSQAFSALARTVLVADKQEDSDQRVLARAKSNIGTDEGGVSYTIEPCDIGGGIEATRDLKIGDLESGAPELRADSRYNRDNAYITQHYALSSDLFAVMIKTAPEGCLNYKTLVLADRLAWELQQYPGVQATASLVNAVRQITAGTYEGNPKLNSIQRNQDVLNYAAQQASVNAPELFNTECSLMPVIAFLKDHKAETLDAVVAIADKFAKENSSEDRQFLLAAGTAGIEAATNIVVREANRTMLLYVYAAVTLFCLITFRSWRATLVALLPLVLTSILCEALMVAMGIGVKVATLPVIALGVGIGVDYALYLLSVQLHFQRQGLPLSQAYRNAVSFTGRVVGLVGITLAAGVVCWVWSPIKFQADMGILLTFMFVWNMLGALILIPALSHFLLRSPRHVLSRSLTAAAESVQNKPMTQSAEADVPVSQGDQDTNNSRAIPS